MRDVGPPFYRVVVRITKEELELAIRAPDVLLAGIQTFFARITGGMVRLGRSTTKQGAGNAVSGCTRRAALGRPSTRGVLVLELRSGRRRDMEFLAQ